MSKQEHIHEFKLMKQGAQSVIACATCGKLKNRIGSIDVKKSKPAIAKMVSDNKKPKSKPKSKSKKTK